VGDREISIVIRAKNLSESEFDKARRGIAGITDETKRGTGANTGWGQSFRASFAGNLASDLLQRGVSTLKSWTEEAFRSAGATLDMANSTGLSTAAVQRMQFAAEQTSSSVEAFTLASFNLGRTLAGGSGSVQQGVAALGLSFTELRQLKPEDQFEIVVGALGRMQNEQERNRIGALLFGKSFKEIAAAVGEGYHQLAEGAQISTDAQLQALDAAGDAWDRFKQNTTANIRSLLGTTVLWGDALRQVIAEGGIFQSTAGVIEQAQQRLNASTEDYTGQLAALAKHFGQEATPAAETYTQQLAKMKAEVAGLTSEQVKEINAAKTLGVATDELTAKYGLSEGALRLVTENTKAATKATDEQAAAVRELEAEMQLLIAGWQTEWAHEWGNDVAASAEKATDLQAATLGMTTALGFWREQIRLANNEARGFDEQGLLPVNEDLRDLIQQTIIGQHTIRAIADEAGKASGKFSGMGEVIRKELGPTIMAALTGGGDVVKSVSGLFGGQLTKNIFGGEAMQKSIASIFGATIGGAFNSILPGIGALAGPLISGIAKLFDGAFGPSKAERQGRETAASFRKGLEAGLSESQRAEAMATGNFQWAASVVAIRDAYLAVGRTEAEALAIADALWQAEKQGPEAVAAVLAQINPILLEHQKILAEGAEAAKKAAGELAALSDPIDILQAKLENLDSIDTLKDAFEDFRKSGTLDLKTVLREVESLHESLGDTAAVKELQEAIGVAVETGVVDFGRLGAAWGDLEAMMREGVVIPLDFKASGGGDGDSGGSKKDDEDDEGDGYLTKDEAREAGVPYVPKDPNDYSDARAKAEAREELNDYYEARARGEVLHGGGWVGGWPRAHRGLWTDEVPLIGQTGERMLSRVEVARMGGRSGVDRIARGEPYGGQRIVIEIPVHLDGKQVARACVPLIPSVLRQYGVRL